MTKLKEYITSIKLPVTIEKVIIGKVNPPQGVLDEAERTASQKQRDKTEIARAATELSRAKAETNKALADKSYTDEFNMTTEEFLKNKKLDIMSAAVASKRGNVSLIINDSEAKPIFSVGREKQLQVNLNKVAAN